MNTRDMARSGRTCSRDGECEGQRRGAPGPTAGSGGGAAVVLIFLCFWLCGCGDSIKPSDPRVKASQAGGRAWFEEVAAQAGLHFTHQLADGVLDNIVESDGAGGVVFDYDGDGWMDLYLVNSGPDPVISKAPAGTVREPNRLFRNRGNGTFEDVTERAGVAGHDFGITAAAGDYDNDGHTDLYVVNYRSAILYRNRGDGRFEDVTMRAGVTNSGGGISATFLDYDKDGYLDLFVANYLVYDPAIQPAPGSSAPYAGPLAYEPELNVLFRNRGDGRFEDVSEVAGVRIRGHRAMSITPLDYNLDGWTDVYVSNDATPNLLLANHGKGGFKEAGLQAGVGFNQFGAADGSMGAAVGDCNGDGWPDLFVTRFGHASLYVNSQGGLFEDRIQASGILEVTAKYTGWGGNFLDYDNDGDVDLFVVNGHAHFMQGMPSLLMENRGEARFADASADGGPFFRREISARGSGAWDYDNDGRMDLVVTTLGGPAVLLRNTGGQRGQHWVTLRLQGTRSNRDGYGALVRITAGGKTQMAECRCPTSYVFQQDSRLHFGLGQQGRIELIEIRWPSGASQRLTDVAADQIVRVREPGESRWTEAR